MNLNYLRFEFELPEVNIVKLETVLTYQRQKIKKKREKICIYFILIDFNLFYFNLFLIFHTIFYMYFFLLTTIFQQNI